MNKRIPPTAPGQPCSISFHKWVSIAQAGAVVLSPDGANIAYTVTTTDWKENSCHTEIWLSRQNHPPVSAPTPREIATRIAHPS
jgi:dipeptidyl aminopeptidase/acylaminoacyl peptidase